jgi:hypothetical protein
MRHSPLNSHHSPHITYLFNTHVLCFPVYAKLNCRFDGSLPERRENTQTGRGLPFAFNLQLSTVNSLTPLQSALPQNRRVTRLESADPKTRHLKSFRIRTYEKGWGEGGTVN